MATIQKRKEIIAGSLPLRKNLQIMKICLNNDSKSIKQNFLTFWIF